MYQPYYGGQYMNPYQVQSNNLIRVNGIDGAKAYQIAPNSTVALFDANEDIMYIKSSDGAGFPTIRIFTFKEMIPETPQTAPTGDYISRKEFEDFKTEVLNYGQQLIQQRQKGQQQSEQSRRSTEQSNRNGKG